MKARIPARYANLLFGGMLSMLMVTIISGTVVAITNGVNERMPELWLRGFLTAWPIAFPSVVILAPRVRRLVNALIAPN
ncbi:MAG: DUF2798 domain-containing protein [Betaproteobacteria bacterium]|nr:DUF2798 domain-containing protein [Betaproteobacteria bacterium]